MTTKKNAAALIFFSILICATSITLISYKDKHNRRCHASLLASSITHYFSDYGNDFIVPQSFNGKIERNILLESGEGYEWNPQLAGSLWGAWNNGDSILACESSSDDCYLITRSGAVILGKNPWKKH